MKRSLALFIINYFLISCITCLDVDPCKRQPFRGRCPVSSNGIQARSQFVLRYYLRNGECVSYPYGHCANDENEPKLYRYKEECQEACIDKKETEIISHSNKDSPIRFSPTKTIINGNNNVEETYETNKSIIETSSSKILTKCEKERIISKDVFKLECDSDGNYKMLQCNAEKQECFCVDEMGKEIPYSRSSPNGVAPDCTTIIKVEKKLFNKCTGKSVYGPCKANLTRWYFEESENKCKSFQYSGCGSNGNNYENELACIDRCIPKKTTTSSEDESHTTISKINTNTICSLPKERGPCDRYDLRFYYNKDLNECKYFFYGGCEGNSNNFIKVEDCEATCGGKPSQTQELLPKNPNNITPEPKIFQTITTKKIHIETTFSQKPIITTTEYPFTENRCLPPKDSGNCNGNFVRWYWNNERKICETFSYSGCAGNSNNFANREECLSICHINAASKDNENEILNPFDVCSHKIDQGECGGNFLRWAFDKKSGNCIKMRYTGCMGNGNNFATEEDCARKCIPGRKPTQQSPACFHSIDVGDCDGVFPRFGYDKNTNECKQYTYSGCNGSPNNFGTYQDCAEACIRLSCPPVTNCDLTRCHILQDVNGCSSCNCPPIVNKNPVINPPPFPIPTKNSNNCPVVDASSCVEPCMIFFNRIGCQECVCPKVPTTEIPIVKSTTNSVIPIVKTSTSSEIVRNKVDAKIQNTLTSQKPIIEKEKPTFQSPSSFEPKKNNEDINSIDNGFVPIVPSFKDVVGDKCTLPVDPGPCKDFIERWYFNINTGLCEPFKFGGCGGSKNHFFTRHECEVHCARFASLSTKQSFISQHTIAPQINTIKPQHNTVQFSQPIKQLNEEIVDICNLPADAGHCFNYIPRWYFNSQKGKCEQFSYGSCGGNKNNFFDKNSCEAKCITVILPKVFSSLPKECTYERDEGFGGEYHPKYYFNFKNLHCEQMIYQGQGGNDNRFDNKIKCENICINRINENNNKLRPLPVQQPSTFVPQSKSTEKWNNNNTLNLFNNNVKGIKIAESVDNNGNTGKTAPIKMIETETSQISVPVPSLENYQQQYNAKPYQTTENVNIPESHHSSIEIKSTTVPENGGYPEVSLISSQSTDVTNIPQTTTLLTTQSYETTENIKNEEIKSTTLEKEVEAHIDPKNTQTIDIIKKLPEEIKTSKSDILISTTDIPTYVSTIGSEDIKPKFEVNINTVPTVKIIQTTDTPTTVKETIPVVSNTENVNKAIETLTTEHIETELTTELPTILTTNEKQTISTTKLQTEIPTQTQSVVENSIQPQITTTIQTESTDTTEIETKKGEILETTPSSSISPNIPSSGSKIETISKITEIENVSSGDRSIKKLDIRPISPTTTIKNIPTELITEKTTIKLETSTISEPSTHNQSIEDDKDLLETNELSKKDAVENKDEYKANTLTEKIINKVPKEQLPIVKESPDPKINYQNRGGNVINGILNQPISKDSQTLEELIPKIDTRIPVCPNKKPALIDRIGNPLSCLPGKKLCPEKSSCIFNGVNFYCCPSPEDPYDHHVFGGYNGEEIKNGYKPLTKTLNILSIANHEPIKRAKRQSMGLDNIYKSLRFEGAPIKQISRANRLHVNGKMLPICNLEVERGNCGESHVRYFYDARIDQCRMFYYSGCQGNGNNFENQLDCERICKIEVNENSKILKDEKKFLNVCGERMTPFGGENPLVCGNENDSIGCPVGYFCRKSSPFICCPKIVEDNDDINQLTIKDIIAKKTGKDTRFAPKINSTYDLHRSNLPRLRTSSGIVVPSSSNICPDGSDSLKEVLTGKPVDCGTGGDGHPLCPIGYYCSMDSFTNTRLCCKLGSIGTKVYAPINESPFSSQKKNSSKELLTKQELPVNVDVSSTTTESLKPLSIAIPSIIEKKNTQKEYNHMMIKPINKGNNQKEIILEENPKLLIDDTHETNIKHIEDSSILMVDEVAMLEPKKILDKSACYISPSEGRGCREDEPVPKTNLQYFYSLKDKKCKLFFYRGCGGSINRFESKKICEALCMMD